MDYSPGSDAMDWKEDSSVHIIQPPSSPWRKRSFDTYNDTIEPYRPHDPYSGYQVTDTFRNDDEVVAPFIDSNGRPAHYVTDSNGTTILQPIIRREPRPPIGYYLPEVVKWLVYGTVLLVGCGIEFAGEASRHYATVAVGVGNSAKRRLVEITKKAFVPAPPSKRRRRHGPPQRRESPLIRRVSPTSPGGRTHTPITPPRARPKATIREAIEIKHECLEDHIPSNPDHVRSGAFVTSLQDDHPMSKVTYHPNFEPLMSGALQNIDMDEDAPSNTTSPFSPYHIPGTFPDSPAPQVPPSTETPAPEAQASDDLAIPHDLNTDDLAASKQQAADEVATPHSEACAEPDIPAVQPIIELSLQPVDSRPRNYKGELLDDWQIKICKEFQAIHPPPKKIRRQASYIPKQPQGRNSTGSIESHRSPLADTKPMTPHQQLGTTAGGSIDACRSPMANTSRTGAADRTTELHGSMTELTHQSRGMTSIGSNDLHRSPLDLHGSTTELLHQPHILTSTGSNDLHRSPLDLHGAATEVLHYPHVPTSIGSNDLHRSPLDLDRATLEILQNPRGTTPVGSNDLHRSPLANVPPTRAGDELNDSHNRSSYTSYEPLRTATIESINSLRSSLVSVSSIDSQQEMTITRSIDSQRSPSFSVSPIPMQLGTNPNGLNNFPGSPFAATSIDAAVHATTESHMADPNVLEKQRVGTTVPSNSPPIKPSATMTTAPAISPSKWSIRSLYARVQGKPKKRSPLCERANNGNIHKAPKTPKKVTWPENGPVTGTKRFLKHQALSQPSPSSSCEDSSILSSVPSNFSPQPSPTMQEEEEEEGTVSYPLYQAYPPNSADDDRNMSPFSSNKRVVLNPKSIIEHTDVISKSGQEETINSSSSSDNEASVQSLETPTKTAAADPSTPPSHLFPKFEELTISTRRSSLRRREKEDQAQKLRDVIAAEEKARKEKEEAEEKARKEKEAAEERARSKVEEEEERRKTGGRRIPIERVIQSLPPGWDEKVRINMAKGMREQLAMTSVGNPLTRRDFGMALPQSGTGDDPSGWLNDEIISGYLQAVVDHGHHAMGHPRGAKPRMHAFTPFFYTTLKDRGYDAVKRWSSRAKIGGNDLKTVEYVFIPCNPSRSHWTLVVVSPVRKTIEVFDSMHGDSSDKVNTTKKWLRGELGRSYVDSEWTVVEDLKYPGRGKGPVQNNANDCGVFAVTTAKMLVLGVDPMAVSAADMPLQRRRLVAELLNGGFSGDFKPHVVFE